MAGPDLARIVLLGADGHGKTALARAMLDDAVARGSTTPSRSTFYVELRTATRHLVLTDPPAGTDVACLLFTMARQDAAVVVVNVEAGVQPQTREQLLIARHAGVDRAIVLISHLDTMHDAELRLMVADDACRAVLASGIRVETVAADWRDVNDAVGRVSLVPREIDAPLLMTAEERVTMKGLGTVVMGTVLRGSAALGEPLELVGKGAHSSTVITSAEAGRRRVERITAGQQVGVLLRGIDQYPDAQLLAAPGLAKERSNAKVWLRNLDVKEGGVGVALQDADAHWAFFGTARSVARLRLPASIAPGDDGSAELLFDPAVVLAEGMPFVLRQGASTVALGRVHPEDHFAVTPRADDEETPREESSRLLDDLARGESLSRAALAVFFEALLLDEPLAWQALDDADQAVGQIAERVAEQLRLIMAYDPLRRLARIWRELHEIVQRAPAGRGPDGTVEILSISLADMVEDMEDCPEVTKSGLWRIVYGGNYGSFGGRPYSVLIYDEPLSLPEHRRVIEWSAFVAKRSAAALVIGRSEPGGVSSDLYGAELVVVDPRSPYELARVIQESFTRYGWGAHAHLTALDGNLADAMILSRFAMMLIVIHREHIGAWSSPEQIRSGLVAWLDGYEYLMESDLAVERPSDEPQYFSFVLRLRPRWSERTLQFDGYLSVD